MAHITNKTKSALQDKIDSYVSKDNGIPGLVCSIVNKQGDVVFEHASGKLGVGSDEPMALDTVLWIASCTKLITSIAAMQLVEKGRLDLDDGDQVERYLPELGRVKVLEETPSGDLRLVEKARNITLRMLLTHTGIELPICPSYILFIISYVACSQLPCHANLYCSRILVQFPECQTKTVV